MLTFKYKIIEDRPIAESVKTPIIPITVKGKISIDTTGIPDSGADFTAVPLSLAEAIGLDLSGPEDKSVGIGGWVKSKDSTMIIELGNARERYSFRTPVKVILDKYDFPILLGRKGFFDKFIITFDERGQRVKLKRYSQKIY